MIAFFKGLMDRAVVLAFMLTMFLRPVIVLAQPTMVEDTSGTAVAVTEVPVATEPSITEVVGWVTALTAAINSGNWTLATALGLMLAVFIARKFFLKRVPGEYLPWVAVALSVALAAGEALYSGKPPMDAIVQGVVTGLAAIGTWEAVKPMAKKKVVG